jgi:hypothetical protein
LIKFDETSITVLAFPRDSISFIVHCQLVICHCWSWPHINIPTAGAYALFTWITSLIKVKTDMDKSLTNYKISERQYLMSISVFLECVVYSMLLYLYWCLFDLSYIKRSQQQLILLPQRVIKLISCWTAAVKGRLTTLLNTAVGCVMNWFFVWALSPMK